MKRFLTTAETKASETIETMKLVPENSMNEIFEDRVLQAKDSIVSDKDMVSLDKNTVFPDKHTSDTQNMNTIEQVVTEVFFNHFTCLNLSIKHVLFTILQKPKKKLPVKTSSSATHPSKN